MASQHWGRDPVTGEMVLLDKEELAKSMWKRILKSKGLPLDTPYETVTDFRDYQHMTWSEQSLDHLWKDIYKKRGLIPTPSDEKVIEGKKAFIEKLKKKLAEEKDLSDFEKMKIGKMMKKTEDDIDELMNKDEPKRTKKVEPVHPLVIMERARLTKEAAKAAASTSF